MELALQAVSRSIHPFDYSIAFYSVLQNCKSIRLKIEPNIMSG